MLKIIDFNKCPGAFVRKDEDGIVSVHLVNSGDGESMSVINIPVEEIITAQPAPQAANPSFFNLANTEITCK